MAARFIVVFSAFFVLAQGSSLLSLEQESEVAIHAGVVAAGAPVSVVSKGYASVPRPAGPAYGHGSVPVPVSVGVAHRGSGLGLAAPRAYAAAPRPAVAYARPAAVAVPAVVVAPVAPIRQPHGVAVPAVVAVGHGNVHGRHHG
ncbi:cuticle protein 21.3 [Drosophila eugracilis]|uniref:cuticle protein 21.3 n=1 Tax=Drosophila eugracilis TaxID=29029 RepID=UPI0007E85439|nr:cuticle protein 21.3 [Drosophila eugracilis]